MRKRWVVLMTIGIVVGVFGLANLAIDLYYYFVIHACPVWWGCFIP